jgi:hypothetical protein
MKNFIAAVSVAAFAHVLAYADESYVPPEPNNTERALPEQTETSERAGLDQAQGEPASPEIAESENTESAAAGGDAQSDGENAAADENSETPREIDQ